MAAAVVVTTAEFRQSFPEFVSPVVYPDEQVQQWIDLGTELTNVLRWKTLTALGIKLFTAHWLVLERQAQRQGLNGAGVPGVMGGVVSNKSVGPGSIGYDTSAATVEGAADWNLTSYGVRRQNLVKLIGAGPLQI